MPKLKNLSGEDIIAILLKCGFSVYNQASHYIGQEILDEYFYSE